MDAVFVAMHIYCFITIFMWVAGNVQTFYLLSLWFVRSRKSVQRKLFCDTIQNLRSQQTYGHGETLAYIFHVKYAVKIRIRFYQYVRAPCS